MTESAWAERHGWRGRGAGPPARTGTAVAGAPEDRWPSALAEAVRAAICRADIRAEHRSREEQAGLTWFEVAPAWDRRVATDAPPADLIPALNAVQRVLAALGVPASVQVASGTDGQPAFIFVVVRHGLGDFRLRLAADGDPDWPSLPGLDIGEAGADPADRQEAIASFVADAYAASLAEG